MIARFEECNIAEIRDGAKLLLFGLNKGRTDWDDAIDRMIMDKAARLQAISTTKIVTDLRLPIVDRLVELPCDYLGLIAIRPVGTTDTTTPSVYLPVEYITNENKPFVQVYNLEWIQNGYMKMPQNLDIDEIYLTYDAANVDENGLPVLFLRYKDVLERWACYTWCLINSDNRVSEFKRLATSANNAIISQDQIDKWNQTKAFSKINMVSRWLY